MTLLLGDVVTPEPGVLGNVIVPVLILLAIPGLFLLLRWLSRRATARRRQGERARWQAMADGLGFERVDAFRLEGTLEGLPAAVYLVSGRRAARSEYVPHELKVEVTLGDRVSPGLSLAKQPEPGLLTGRTPEDVATGDAEFDAAVLARGPDDEVRARLGARARRLAKGWIGDWEARLEGGVLSWKGPEDTAPELVVKCAKGLAAIASELVAHGDDPAVGLAHHACEDDLREVRRACMTRLLTGHLTHPATLEAARRWFPEGHGRLGLLEALQHLDEDPTAPLRWLDHEDVLDFDRVNVLHLLVDRAPEAVREALAAHGERLAADGSAISATRLMRAAWHAGASEAAPWLLHHLDSEDPVVARSAVAIQLAFGGVEAVPRLKEAMERHGKDRRFVELARLAVADIQGRAEHGGAGHLSIVEAADGGLSLVAGEGALSDAGET